MRQPDPFLSVRLEGSAVGPGRIGVDLLLRLLQNMNKAFLHTGRALVGESEDSYRKSSIRSIRDEIALNLMLLTHGSEAAVLGFEPRTRQPSLPEMGIFEKSLKGLALVQQPGTALPVGFSVGALMAWRDVGCLFTKGVTSMAFKLNHRPHPMNTLYTPDGFRRLQDRILGPQLNFRAIEGRLLMADFKEHGTRCRVHPSIGEPVLCLFEEDQKEEVLDNILHFVRVVGEAKEDPLTHKMISITIQDIQRMEDREMDQVDLIPQGGPLPSDFWRSPTLDELAEAQGVRTMEDVAVLFGTWPGEVDDGFEESIIDVRRHGPTGTGG